MKFQLNAPDFALPRESEGQSFFSKPQSAQSYAEALERFTVSAHLRELRGSKNLDPHVRGEERR